MGGVAAVVGTKTSQCDALMRLGGTGRPLL